MKLYFKIDEWKMKHYLKNACEEYALFQVP